MDLEKKIKSSDWWQEAARMPDRHYAPEAGIFLTDHLESVHDNLRFLDNDLAIHDYYQELNSALSGLNIDPAEARKLLSTVALLHDIGKTREEKTVKMEHPLKGKAVNRRHPVMGLVAALELLPLEVEGRETILALIDDHATPFAWFVQFRRNGQIPKRKAWARLDRKIDSREDGTGLVLLCLFKLADIDGHEEVDDVVWFIEQANNYLQEKGKQLPVPDRAAIESLTDSRV